MANCTNCYGTNTVQPCDAVGCLSTNFGKCITYSGANLYCAAGSIATFTFSGTAVSPTLESTVTVSASGGSGTGATFEVTRTPGETTYTVVLDNPGSAYEVTDVLTIAGTDLGGTSPANDISVTVATLAAVIANGDNLDTIITNINNRLCLASEASPSGLDYTAFNYACLRVGGNLEGVGTVITTAKDFVEATAAALCSLNVRLSDVELPGIIVDSYFGGSIVSGVSTIIEVLDAYGAAIGDVNDKFTINAPGVCGSFSHFTNLTAKPSSTASLGTWFDWVHGNMCTIYGELDGYLSEIENQLTDINVALWGLNTPYPTSGEQLFVDTSCLTGGLANDRIISGLQLVTDELCSLKTTVSGLSNPTYTVDWSCFTAPYAANSVFGVQGLGSFTGTTTVQGHLDQIAQALSDLNIKFNNSHFTITNSTCGPVVSLSGGFSFSCSSLATCTLDNMADVGYSVVAPNQILVRDSLNATWFNTSQTIKVTTPNGGSLGSSDQYKDFSYDGVTGKFTSNLTLPIVDNGLLLESTTLPTALSLTHATLYSQLPLLTVNKSSGLVMPNIAPGFLLQNISGSPYVITNNTTINILRYTNSQFKAPTEVYIPATVVEKNAAMQFSAVRQMVLRIDSNSASGELIGLTNVSGDSITLPAGFYLEVYFGGVTWPMVL